jgi:Cu2+-exporting ATPase
MNCNIEVISGDNCLTTRTIASQLGVDHALSEASPILKKDHIARLQNEGRRVMMVGDGINDAPALTQASVGVAMGRGTDIAMESADAVLIRNDLTLVPYLIDVSRKTYAIIKQNIFWSFFYNIVAIPLAVAGLLHPIMAAGAMAASSLFVVGNSLRIRE